MQTIDEVADRLRRAGCIAAESEAAELLADKPDPVTLEGRVGRREVGEPLAWITGRTTFCGQRITVRPGVYVPRPQTEELARRGAAVLPDTGRALDLCAGAGAIAAVLHVARPRASVVAVDLDPLAASCARSNGVAALIGDLDAPLRPAPRFDVITAVAPYVPTDQLAFLPSDVRDFEPRRALDGGIRGVAIVERIIDAAARLLLPGGHLLLELGGDQDTVLTEKLGNAFTEVDWLRDDDGDLRGVACSVPRQTRVTQSA